LEHASTYTLRAVAEGGGGGGGGGSVGGMSGGIGLVNLMSLAMAATPSPGSGPGLFPGTSMDYFSGVLAGYSLGDTTATLTVAMSDGQTAVIVVSSNGQVIGISIDGGVLGTIIWGTEASLRDK